MNKAIENYATAIYQNTMTGVQSIRDIESKVEDERLKAELLREADEFNIIAERLKRFAVKNDFKVQENNFIEKSRLWASINMTTLFDRTSRHIAEMMLLGTVMGLITCYKDKYDHQNISEELDSILQQLEDLEEENYLTLKKYLKSL